VIGGVILSWVSPGNPHPLLQLIDEISDKILSPIRNYIPSMGGLDFSPLLVLIILNQVDILLASIVRVIL
jgi:YggT family protein